MESGHREEHTNNRTTAMETVCCVEKIMRESTTSGGTTQGRKPTRAFLEYRSCHKLLDQSTAFRTHEGRRSVS
eukprot:3059805-Heterocapsa_arctica.AAC.1